MSLVRFRGYGERGKPRGASRCTQLSHLPIGPSHVLICLLVNPPYPSLIVYFVLSLSLSFLNFRGTPLLLSPLLLSHLFALFSILFRGLVLFSLLVLPFRSLSALLRTKSRGRSLQNELDHLSTDETGDWCSVPIISRIRELRNLIHLYIWYIKYCIIYALNTISEIYIV